MTSRYSLKFLLFLAAVVLLLVALAVGSGEAEGKIITVDDDGGGDYERIQDAIDNTTEGDEVRVWEGTYYENVVVNKTVSLIGNGSANTTIDGGGSGDVLNITASWVNLTGFRIRNGGSGEGEGGILIRESHARIAENSITGNFDGIVIGTYANYSSIINNSIVDNRYGVRPDSSSHHCFSGNHYTDNDYGLYGSYINFSRFENDILTGGEYPFVLYKSENNTIEGLNVSEASMIGILITHAHNSTLKQNSCQDNEMTGIEIRFSENCEVQGNNCSRNKQHGIVIHWETENATVRSNICQENSENGIRIYRSNNTRVCANNCSKNGENGIFSYNSGKLVISNNSCYSNKENGIYLEISPHCTVEDNHCSEGNSGVNLEGIAYGNITGNDCPGNLRGIRLYNVHYTEIGSNTLVFNNWGLTHTYSSGNLIQDNLCSDNTIGIYIHESVDIVLLNNTINRNEQIGITLLYDSTNNTAHDNSIVGNGEYGISASGDDHPSFINATFNWWGHSSGPYHETKNPGGKGDNITDNVEFDPWHHSSSGSRSPTAIIHAITPNPAYHYQAIRFQGNGTDDGELVRYSWRSSIDRELYNGTNASFTISNLSRGTHTIYLKVQDDGGIWSEEVSTKLDIKPESRKQPSSIGLYMKDVDDCLTLWVEAGKDDDITLELRLENHNASDFVERVVLLYVLTDVKHGDEDNWEFRFPDAENGGIPIYEGEHPDYGTMSFYKYVVKGDGTPTNVTFRLWHDYEIPIDNEDDIEFVIYGLDYEAEDEPEQGEELERFLFKIIENGSCQNHNVTYLMEDGEKPNVAADNAKGLRVFVLPDNFCFCVPLHFNKSSINMVADEIYDELVVTVKNELGQDDELNLVAVLDDPTAEWWNITAQAPYTLGDFFPVDGSPCGVNGYFDVTLLISLKDPANHTKVPHGSYDLKLTVESRLSGFTDETTVTITLLQRYDPGITLDPTDTDDKIAHTNGTPTNFKFRVRNNGILTDTIVLLAQVQNLGSRAGDTNDYWTKMFYPASPLVDMAPGETIDVMVNLTPTLSNELIPPGKYPVYVNVSSTNNIARKDQEMVSVRMPSLYVPPVDPVVPPFRIGSEHVISFTVKNLGKAEDTLALGLDLRDSEGDLVASLDEPGRWLFSFENADTGAPLTDLSVTLASWAEQDVHLRITPMAGTPSGDYTLHISITPGELGQDTRTVDVPLTVLPLDLWITSEGIEITPSEVDEGEQVTIRATVHLDGAIETPISVEFFYKTTSSGFVYLGGVELDFGGKVNTEETVTFTWDKANVPRATGQNIRVWVDAADLVKEENETNNAASATITVRESEAGEPHSSFLWVGLVATAVLILIIPAAMFLPKFMSRKQKRKRKGKN